MPKGSKATGGGAPKSSGKFSDKRGIDALKAYVGQPLQPNRFVFPVPARDTRTVAVKINIKKYLNFIEITIGKKLFIQ